MRIAVMSDTHDNLQALESALDQMEGADVVLHSGDLCAPFVVKRVGEALSNTPVHLVWGNNDGDQHLLTAVAADYPNLNLHGLVARLEVDGWRVGVCHYPGIARDMALSGEYRLVCYGHDHTAHEEQVGDCLLLNPGEVMGMNGRHSFAWVDTKSGEITFVDL